MAFIRFDDRHVQAETYVATVASTTVISSGLPPIFWGFVE